MSWWVPCPLLAPGEPVVWERAASQPQRRRLVGGRFFLSPSRLIFQPNRLEAATGGQVWVVGLHEIRAVLPERGLRRKLRIDVAGDRPPGLFYVADLDRNGEELVARVNHLRQLTR